MMKIGGGIMRGRYYIQKQSLNSICENLFHVFSILFIYMKKIVHIHCFFLLIIGGLSSQDSSIRDEIIFDNHNNINGGNYHSLALTASVNVIAPFGDVSYLVVNSIKF